MPDKKEFEIRKQYEPSDQEYEALQFIYKDRYPSMRDSDDRVKSARDWDTWEKQYESWRPIKKSWQSNHVVPMTHSVVETALSEMIDQNLRPMILPRGSEDIPKAQVMGHIFDYTWEVADSDLALYNIIKDTLMFGTGIGQEYYWQDKRIVQKLKSLDSKTKKKTYEEYEVVDYDDVMLEVVRLQDFFVDEKARGFTGTYAARDCIRRYIMNINDFRNFFKGDIWDQFNNVQYVVPGGNTDYYEFYQPPDGIDHSKDVEVLWYWGRKPKDRLLIVANDVVIKDGPNPYNHKQLPFSRAVDIKRVHRFYGKGEAELLESMQDEATTLRRMIIDRNHLDIDKMFFVSNRLSLNDEDLIARPHGMIPVDDVNAAKSVEYGDIPRSVELSLKHLEDDSTISTGINPRAQALPTAGTATEAAILKESTLKRMRLKIWTLKKEFLIQQARLRVANILQFYSQPKLEKIVGERGTQQYEKEMERLKAEGTLVEKDNQLYQKKYRDIRTQNTTFDYNEKGTVVERPAQGIYFFELKPEYFLPVSRGGYDIKFDAGSNIELSKPLLQTKMLELYDRLMQLALQVPNSYDPIKIADMVVETYDKDPNDLKVEQQPQEDSQARVQMSIDLANMENKQMSQGQQVPATPMASPAHTRVHLEYMNSDKFQHLPNNSPIVQDFTQHVTGEIMAQQTREGGSPEQQAQQGQPQATSVSQGIQNQPGGMQQPATSIGEVLPALQTGGNKNLQ